MIKDLNDLDLDAPLDPPVQIEKVLTEEEIKHMIAQLSVTEDGEPLKNAMRDLKRGLLANPAASASLLPEDIGEMVKHLYRMTGKDVEDAIAKASKNKKGGSKQPKFDFSDPKIQQEILDDLD